MSLSLAEKKAVVQQISDVANRALSAVAAEYSGLLVSEFTELRTKARNSGVYLRVIPNNLARRALSDTQFACMADQLKGPLFMAFSLEDPGAAARLIRDFSKDHEKLKVRVLSISGRLLQANEIDVLAKLPTYKEAIAQLLFMLKAPAEQLVRTLAAPTVKLVRTLAAVRDQKQ